MQQNVDTTNVKPPLCNSRTLLRQFQKAFLCATTFIEGNRFTVLIFPHNLDMVTQHTKRHDNGYILPQVLFGVFSSFNGNDRFHLSAEKIQTFTVHGPLSTEHRCPKESKFPSTHSFAFLLPIDAEKGSTTVNYHA